MTDINRIFSVFPYDHESNPARLFEAIGSKKDIHYHARMVGYKAIGPWFKSDGKIIYTMPSDIDWNDRWAINAYILRAMLAQGYRYRKIKAVNLNKSQLDEQLLFAVTSEDRDWQSIGDIDSSWLKVNESEIL